MRRKRLVEKVKAFAASQAKGKAIPTKPRQPQHTLAEALFHTKRRVGRPTEPKVQRLGQEAAKLRQLGAGRTWGQIHLKLCPTKGKHTPDDSSKRCQDRIRLAAQPYLKKN